MENKTIVIFCNWKRINNIETILLSLKNQTTKDFDIGIWNNNTEDSDKLNELKNKYNFYLINSEVNIGGIGRFYMAKYYSNKYNNFIFIDDDQVIGNNFIKQMVMHYEPKTIKSRWGWKFNSKNYSDRIKIQDNKFCNYCGTGGMIGDISIFEIDEIFEVPLKYSFIEDLWLSYIAFKYDFKTIGIPETLHQLNDGKDQYNILKPLKNVFLNDLVDNFGWKL